MAVRDWNEKVSIQLVSPTSGEMIENSYGADHSGFHSISFPNEWGAFSAAKTEDDVATIGFHSISFPNEWGGSKN